MRIAIFVTNDGASYGGGRLASLLLAHCLARAGCEVCYVANNKPVFYDELAKFSQPSTIPLYLSKDFHEGVPPGDFDVVILIPTQAINILFYAGARGFARRRNARLALFNFESPNWFNAYAPIKRDESLWSEWRRCTEDGCLILSNSRESMKYAQEYYVDHPERTWFDYWHQPINILALNGVSPQLRENRIVGFVRAADPHKGGQDLLDSLSADLAGFTLSLIVGGKKLDPAFEAAANQVTQRFGMSLEVKTLVSEADKFVEIKRARMLVYPSRFEGYGIPPIEALACGTPCVCYDLPVLHEVCGSAVHYAVLGDVEGLRSRIREILGMPVEATTGLVEQVRSVLDVETCGIAARDALERYLAGKSTPGRRAQAAEAAPTVPDPSLLSLSKVRVDPAGHIEVEGRYPVRGTGEVAISVDDAPLGHAFRRSANKDAKDAAFSFIAPFDLSKETFTVTATLIAADGKAASDKASKQFAVKDVKQPGPAIDAALLRTGGIRYVREDAGAILHGWIAGAHLPLDLQVFIDGRPAWVRGGRARPDVAPKIADLPPQSPGFVAQLRLPRMEPESQSEVLVAIYSPKGSYAYRTKVKPQSPAKPARVEAPATTNNAGPHSLPLLQRVRRVSIDEYRVAEFEGYILARPRIDVMRFYVDDEFLGEGISDRLDINTFEKNRAYGDVYCGFMFVGRVGKPPRADSKWRIELLYGDDVVETLTGSPTLTTRAEADYNADASILPGGLIESSPDKVVLFLTGDPAVAHSWSGVERRALIKELRSSGRKVIAVLHGNPHAFREHVADWRQLVDGLLVVNPLSPLESMDGAKGRPTRKLRKVLDNLVALGPVEALVTDGFDLAFEMHDVDDDLVKVALDDGRTPLKGTALAAGSAFISHVITTSSERLKGLAAMLPQARVALWSIDGDRLQDELKLWPAQPVPDTASSWYFLDATAGAGKLTAAAIKRARKAVAAKSNAALGVIIDMSPLLPDAEIRQRLGLPDDIAIVWPGVVHLFGPDTDANVILLGPSLSPVALSAMTKGAALLSLSTKGALLPHDGHDEEEPATPRSTKLIDLLPTTGLPRIRTSLAAE